MVSKEQYRRETIMWMIIVFIFIVAFGIAVYFAHSYYDEMKYQESKAELCYEDYYELVETIPITSCSSTSDCSKNNTAIGCKKSDCNWCCCDKWGRYCTCTLIGCSGNITKNEEILS